MAGDSTLIIDGSNGLVQSFDDTALSERMRFYRFKTVRNNLRSALLMFACEALSVVLYSSACLIVRLRDVADGSSSITPANPPLPLPLQYTSILLLSDIAFHRGLSREMRLSSMNTETVTRK